MESIREISIYNNELNNAELTYILHEERQREREHTGDTKNVNSISLVPLVLFVLAVSIIAIFITLYRKIKK